MGAINLQHFVVNRIPIPCFHSLRIHDSERTRPRGRHVKSWWSRACIPFCC